MAGKSTPCEGRTTADTWVSPVPASVAPPARGDEVHVGLDARSAARAIAEPSVRVLGGAAQRVDADVTDSSTTFAVGALLDSRYEILRFVGRGGMGEVYEAHDQLMDRHVALKTILRSVADRSRAARRFKAEVRNAQRVAHPHVCRIHDLHEHHDGGSEAPLPFFTMELIDGERLAQRLLGGALPLEETRRLALQLLDGLAAAHARGVLHLDFKSDNVMLRHGRSQPEVAIMDFGLSRVHGDSGGLLTSDRRQFAGTLPYMSIEQLECRESLGPATDVYAFGVVLYEMLTRTLPFDGESLGTLLMKQLNERPPPPSRRTPGLSPAIDRFVLRCLDREPRQRFSDAGAAFAALNAIEQWTRPRAPFTRWQTAWPAAALLVAGGVLLSRRSAEPPAPAVERDLAQMTTRLAPWPARAMPAPVPARVAATAAAPALPETSPRAPDVLADTITSAAPTTVPSTGLVETSTDGASAGPRRAKEPHPAQAVATPLLASPPPDRATATPLAVATVLAEASPGAGGPAASAAESWMPTRVPKRLSTTAVETAVAAAPLPTASPALTPLDPPAPAPTADGQNRPR